MAKSKSTSQKRATKKPGVKSLAPKAAKSRMVKGGRSLMISIPRSGGGGGFLA